MKLKLSTADQFAFWTRAIEKRGGGAIPEIAANGILTLLSVACKLLDRKIAAQAEAFQREGGFTERLYRTRVESRKNFKA